MINIQARLRFKSMKHFEKTFSRITSLVVLFYMKYLTISCQRQGDYKTVFTEPKAK